MSQWKPVLNKHYVTLLKEDIVASTISLVSFLCNPDYTIRWNCSNYSDTSSWLKFVRRKFRNQLNTLGYVLGVNAGRILDIGFQGPWSVRQNERHYRRVLRRYWVGTAFLWRPRENHTMFKTLFKPFILMNSFPYLYCYIHEV